MEMRCTLLATPDNPDVGDMFLDASGNPVFTSVLAEEVAQRLTVAFNFFKGEWFLSLDEGTPWYQAIMVKNPADRIIRSVFTQIITGCEGVDELMTLAYSISRGRHLAAKFKARLVDGTVFSSTNYAPYILAI